MRALFDVSVLIAMFDPGHLHHDEAHAWWSQHKQSGWASCPLTQNGFVRIVSQPRYPNAITTTDAVRRLRAATTDDAHNFWADELSITDRDYFVDLSILGPKQVTDLYLLALAVSHSGRLVTFDQALGTAPVVGATADHLVLLPG